MTLQTLIIVAIILIALATAVEFALAKRRRESNQAMTVADEANVPVFPNLVGEVKEFSDRVIPKKQPPLTAEFRAWAAESLDGEKTLQSWLASLSDEGLEALSEQLAIFCTDLNLELGWLVNKEMERAPELKRAVEEIVISYCQACWQAAQIQNELNEFRAYHDIVSNPDKHRDVKQKLYAELVKEELAPSVSPDLLLGSKKQQQEHINQTLRYASQTDPQKFDQIYQNVIATVAANGTTNGTEKAEAS